MRQAAQRLGPQKVNGGMQVLRRAKAEDGLLRIGVETWFPLRPAWDAGADVMHVIYMDPDIRNIPVREIENTFDTLDKLVDHLTPLPVRPKRTDLSLGRQ